MTAARRAAAAAVLGAGLASAARVADDLVSEDFSLDDFLSLCDASIVESTCQTYFGREDGNGLVGPQDVKPILSATAESMDELWAELQLPEGQQVTCADLCSAITETIKRTRTCPPRSDVGCYFKDDGEEACDVDVRPDTIKQDTRNEGDLPDYNDESTLHLRIQDPEAPRMRSRGTSDEIDYAKEVAVRRTANLFRIYPSALVTVDSGDDEDDTVAEDLGGGALLQAWDGSRGCLERVCAGVDDLDFWCGLNACKGCDMCKGHSDDTAHEIVPHNHSFEMHEKSKGGCKVYFDTKADFEGAPGFKALVKCERTGHGGTLDVEGYEPLSLGTFNAGTKYIVMHESLARFGGKLFKLHYRTVTGRFIYKARLAEDGSASPGPAWKQHIQRVNVKAMAYVQTALQRFHKKDTPASIEKWYGPGAYTNPDIRQKLGKTLNSVNDMLGNVEYVMGPKCSRSTFAYVYPSAYTTCKSSELSSKPCTKNNKGQFIFYICQLTLDTHLGEQIETLTHEGSHHAFAYTDDVDFEGGTAYGRRACAKLAKRNWEKAIKNADNFCYYVQDVTDGV